MFDVGFSELIVIALVALVVIGPERLPGVARTVGHLLGRLQRYVGDVKADISREMQLEELKKLQEQVAGEARDMEKQVNEQMAAVDESLNNSILQGIEDKPATGHDAAVPAEPLAAKPDSPDAAGGSLPETPVAAAAAAVTATPDKTA